MTILRYSSKNYPFAVTRNNQLSDFRSKRFVGIEWEYNYFQDIENGEDVKIYCHRHHEVLKNVKNWLDKWSGDVHEDGSCGWELLTPPVAGNFAYNCIKELGIAMVKDKVKVDRTCSVHTHVHAKDLSYNDIKKLITVYSKIEPMLYIIGGHKRYNNDYCSPIANGLKFALKSDNHWKEYLNKVYNTTYLEDRHGGNRYVGLNLIPWFYGKPRNKNNTTVEFRIHKETTCWKEVVKWTELCALIVDFAKQSSIKDIENLPKNSVPILLQIAPHREKWIRGKIKEYLKTSSNPFNYYKGSVFATGGAKFTNNVAVKGCSCTSCSSFREKEFKHQKKQYDYQVKYNYYHIQYNPTFKYNDYNEILPIN